MYVCFTCSVVVVSVVAAFQDSPQIKCEKETYQGQFFHRYKNKYHGNDSKISWIVSLSSFSSFSVAGDIECGYIKSWCLEPVTSCVL